MNRLILAAVLVLPAAAFAAPVESLSAGAEIDFANAPALARPLASDSAKLARKPVLQPALKPQPVRATRVGAELARVNLAAALDRNLHLKNYTLGSRALDLGVATDAAFKNYFLAFTDGAGSTLRSIGDPQKLRGEGVNIDIDASTSYNFRVEVNGVIFGDPIRDSILHITPLKGGTNYDPTTGEIVDAIHARATVFSIDKAEYMMAYGRDVLPDGSGFAATNSFLFIRINGLSTKAWPLAESALKADAAAVVKLGDASVQLTRTSGGELIINAAR